MAVALWHPQTLDRISLEIEFDQDDRFVPDDPAVVSGVDRDDLRRLALDPAAVGVFDMEPAAGEKADMRVHAQVGADDGFHVGRPSESGRVDHALHASGARSPGLEPNTPDVAAQDVFERREQRIARRGPFWSRWAPLHCGTLPDGLSRGSSLRHGASLGMWTPDATTARRQRLVVLMGLALMWLCRLERSMACVRPNCCAMFLTAERGAGSA
jgi:hypothetical protein